MRERERAFPRWYIDAVVGTEVGVARKQSLPKKPLLTRPDHVRKFYGANLAEVFRTPLYDCSLKNVCGVPDFALTRLRGGPMEMQRAPAYPEDRAILISIGFIRSITVVANAIERETPTSWPSIRARHLSTGVGAKARSTIYIIMYRAICWTGLPQRTKLRPSVHVGWSSLRRTSSLLS